MQLGCIYHKCRGPWRASGLVREHGDLARSLLVVHRMRESGAPPFSVERALRFVLGVAAVIVLMVVMVRRACACTTVESAYLTTMRFELREAIVAQERYNATHGHYASDLLAAYAPEPSNRVEFTDFRLTANGFDIEVAVPSGTRTRCGVSYDGSPPIAICGNRPPRALHLPALPAPE